MKLTDRKIKKIIKGKQSSRPRGPCPDEEALASFIEDKLQGHRADEILGHLARCKPCTDAVMALRTIMSEGDAEAGVRVPLSLIERGRKIDPSRKSAMDVVIRFIKGAVEIVRASGGVAGALVPATEHLRGESRVVSENLVTLTKSFSPFSAEVDVEKTRHQQTEITVRLTDENTGSPASGLRVSLFDRDREMESAMIDDGAAVFENLNFGKYRLEITRVGEPVGRITLEMKGEGK